MKVPYSFALFNRKMRISFHRFSCVVFGCFIESAYLCSIVYKLLK